MTATIKQQILGDLDRLSPEQQRQAVELVRSLATPLPSASVEDLMTVAGTLDDESARQMREATRRVASRWTWMDCSIWSIGTSRTRR